MALAGALARGNSCKHLPSLILLREAAKKANLPTRSMAYLEIRRILCKLLWTFDIEVCPESKNWTANQKVYVVWVKPNLMVKLKPVKR